MKTTALILLLAVAFIPTRSVAQLSPAHVLVPAYFFPYDAAKPGTQNVGPYWSAMIDAAKVYPNRLVAVANPNSGPGSGTGWELQKYKEAIDKLRAQKGHVVGYVHLCWGLTSSTPASCPGRTLAAIKSEIDKWKAWYNVDGIFFDEAPNTAEKVAWLKDLDAYVVSKFGPNRILVNNYGTMPTAGYFGNPGWVNIIMEQTAAYFDGHSGQLPAVNNANNTVLIHTMTSGTWQSRRDILKSKGFGYYYITTDGLDGNRWDSLPAFFSDLFK
jgi:hypothetical protein